MDLISSNVVSQLFDTLIRRDNSMRIILANNKQITLDTYDQVYVNVASVMAIVKAFVMPKTRRYSMLVGLRWLRRVRSSIKYESKTVTINRMDNVRRHIQVRKVPKYMWVQVLKGLDREVEVGDELLDVKKMLQKTVKENDTATSDNVAKRKR